MRGGLLLASAAFVVASVPLGGCQALPTVGTTRSALTTVGYQVNGVEPFLGKGGSHVDVRVAAAAPEDGETGKVAGVVWTTIPFRFDRLDVTVDGPQGQLQESFTHAQLVDRFGPRLPELERRDYGSEVGVLTSQLLAGVALPAVVLMGGIGSFVLLSGRRRWPRRGAARPRPG